MSDKKKHSDKVVPNWIKRECKKEWITDKIDNDCINYVEKLGEFLCDLNNEKSKNAVTTSQLRNIFGEIKRIETKASNNEKKWQKECKQLFLLLRPKIAYSAARVISKNNYSRMRGLKEVLDSAHSNVQDLNQFKNFSNFFEGILAFHKSYGGKD